MYSCPRRLERTSLTSTVPLAIAIMIWTFEGQSVHTFCVTDPLSSTFVGIRKQPHLDSNSYRFVDHSTTPSITSQSEALFSVCISGVFRNLRFASAITCRHLYHRELTGNRSAGELRHRRVRVRRHRCVPRLELRCLSSRRGTVKFF